MHATRICPPRGRLSMKDILCHAPDIFCQWTIKSMKGLMTGGGHTPQDGREGCLGISRKDLQLQNTSRSALVSAGQLPTNFQLIFFQPCHMSQKASLHFCQECNNLLYPKADAQRRIIVYACRICQYSEIVENQLV